MSTKIAQFCKVPHKIARCPNLSPIAARLLITLLTFDPCFPSYKALIKFTGMSRGTVAKALKELVAMNLITVQQGNNLKGQSNKYTKVLVESEWLLESTD